MSCFLSFLLQFLYRPYSRKLLNQHRVSTDKIQPSASISGTIVDRTQAVIAGAHIKLTRDENTAAQEATSGGDGTFSFSSLPPGPFHLTITATGFAGQTSSGDLLPGETRNLSSIALAVAKADTEVLVSPATNVEVAEEQIKVEEQQRGKIQGFPLRVNFLTDVCAAKFRR